jgi:hypothetical protein
MTIGDAFGRGERRPQLRGISGWLLLLCIMLLVVFPLRLAVVTWAILRSPIPMSGQPLSIVLFAVVPLATGIIAGILLYREQRLGLRLAQLLFSFQLLFAAPAFIADFWNVITAFTNRFGDGMVGLSL